MGKDFQTRTIATDLQVRNDKDSEMYIEGYFVVFGQETELWQGAHEEIAPTAFEKTISDDIRALINHDTTLVLGRTKSNTLELKTDTRGLWGKIKINPSDTDAVNLYERVKRGDVDQCSFGFEVISEEMEYRDDGSVKWTVTEVKLFEVSVTTFPAYKDTGVQARHSQLEQHKEKQLEVRKTKLKEKVKKWH